MEEFQLPDFSQFPKYLPVHSSLRVNTDFTHNQLVAQIDAKLSAAKKTAESFLAFIAENAHLLQEKQTEEFLATQLDVVAQLSRSKYKLQTLQNTLRAAHRTFVESRRQEQDLSLANYFAYEEIDKANFADSVAGDLDACIAGDDSFSAILDADSSYQYLKNAAFVMKHPEDPLPDEKSDEDLLVAGGKISLKDPLSLNYFVEPVASRKCGHVYEREHIARSLRTQPRINCPVTGCAAQISSGDLREDKLMALRVKVYLAQEKKREVVRI